MSKKQVNKLSSQIDALEGAADSDIDYSDIPSIAQAPARLRNGSVGRFYRPLKVQKTLRIDADVLGFFESLGKGYQTRINAVLRECVTPSEAILVEVRARAQRKDFKGVAVLIRSAESLQPEIRPYIRARTRAAILNGFVRDNETNFLMLADEIAREPPWWKAMEQKAADPDAFPRAVHDAMRKVNEVLTGIRPERPARSGR